MRCRAKAPQGGSQVQSSPRAADRLPVTTSEPIGDQRRIRLGVGGKFLLILCVLVPAVVSVAVVAGLGLRRMHDGTTTLTDQRLRTVQHSADLVSAAYALHETALLQIAADNPQMDASVNTELDEVLVPRFRSADVALRGDYAEDPASLTELQRIRQGLQPYLDLHGTQLSTEGRAAAGRLSAAGRARLADRIDEIFTDVVGRGERMRARESALADDTRQDADATYRSTLVELSGGVVAVLVLGLVMVAVLVRHLVPRIRGYSRFATEVAAGRPTDVLTPSGGDELTELGHALNAMVDQRELQAQVEAAQAEFVDTLQVADTEDEAHDLVKRHLERSVPGSSVVVLRRNNSANKLEAATPLPPGDALTDRLRGAHPRPSGAGPVGETHPRRAMRSPTGSAAPTLAPAPPSASGRPITAAAPRPPSSPARSAPAAVSDPPASRCSSAARSSARCGCRSTTRRRRTRTPRSARRWRRRRRCSPTCATSPSPSSAPTAMRSRAYPTSAPPTTRSSGWWPSPTGPCPR